MCKKVQAWFFSTTPSDIAILILRVLIGASFIVHGYPKITGGIEKWAGLGGAMANLGINFFPVFWGFCAAISEFGGGIALVTGFLSRLAAAGIGFTMVVATIMHLTKGDGFEKYSHPIELFAVCLFLILTGPGAYSIDNWINKKIA